MKQLTVAELIAQLQQMPSDMLVFMEGCDCYQGAGVCMIKPSTKTSPPYVLIANDNTMEDVK